MVRHMQISRDVDSYLQAITQNFRTSLNSRMYVCMKGSVSWPLADTNYLLKHKCGVLCWCQKRI